MDSPHVVDHTPMSAPLPVPQDCEQKTSTALPVYFVCNRCEYPICGSSDIILQLVDEGASEHAFQYDLEYLLDLDTSAPCYSMDEAVDTSISISERILDIPLPPGARLLALESIVNSRRNERHLREAAHARLSQRGTRNTTAGVEGPSSERAAAESAQSMPDPHVTSQEEADSEQRQSPQLHIMPTDDTTASPAYHLISMEDEREEEGSSSHVATQAGPSSMFDSTDSERDFSHSETADSPVTANSGVANVVESYLPTSMPPSPLAPSRIQALQRYSLSTQKRIDLVCVNAHIIGAGLQISSKDRSAELPTEGPVMSDSLSRVPKAILEAARRPPQPTVWTSTSNFSVVEDFVKVTRTTASASGHWFKAYQCDKRVECPDCHLPLGYVFVRRNVSHVKHGSSITNEGSALETVVGSVRGCAEDRTDDVPIRADEDGNAEPHSKKVKKEGRPQGEITALSEDHAGTSDTENTNSHFPDLFVGLELKSICQREWGLQDFQKRYAQATTVQSFRQLFPEAEELQSLYSRLTALRTQSELYNNLLRKHKEQNDVQSALLQSQKERIRTYEEKLGTMQQIVDAQRTQLGMQGSQIRHQEELIRNHRHQVMMQQRQIEVERLLLAEHSKTIESQREQIRLMRSHLDAKYKQEQLVKRRLDLDQQLREVMSHVRAVTEPAPDSSETGDSGDVPPTCAPFGTLTAVTMNAEVAASDEVTQHTGDTANAGLFKMRRVEEGSPSWTGAILARSQLVDTTGTMTSESKEVVRPPLHLRGVYGREPLKPHVATLGDAATEEEEPHPIRDDNAL